MHSFIYRPNTRNLISDSHAIQLNTADVRKCKKNYRTAITVTYYSYRQG